MQSDTTIQAKKAAAHQAACLIKEDMLIGIGTGSTATFFIEALAKRLQAGLKVVGVASSEETARYATSLGIPLQDASQVSQIDITVDGADEVDEKNQMIKGKGGALFREKKLALASQKVIIIIDHTKLVSTLGKTPVPIEIHPFLYLTTLAALSKQGYKGTMRKKNEQLYLTNNQNYIVDIGFTHPILDPIKEHERLKEISGVLETGFFFNLPLTLIIGDKDGSIKTRDGNSFF